MSFCTCPSYYAAEDYVLTDFCLVHGVPPYRAQWTTREGEALEIESMTDEHLANARTILQRSRDGKRSPQYEAICDEVESRKRFAEFTRKLSTP